ncbi:TMF family protein [Flavobacterium poyangense]|uniref:TMF family protein n=1 Tax=Flavobacterium poyangense TaxID=2204302 RepID=UPI00141F090F|nr:TMF family protein [Flavobacterium sp. JXAS1]
MKKFFLLFVIFVSQTNFAQNTFPFPETGSVGIGTTTPIGKLDINTGLSGGTVDVNLIPNGTISFGNGSASTAVPTILGRSNNNVGLQLQAGVNDFNASGDIMFNARKNDGTDFTTLTTPAFRFARFATVLMDVMRNGNTVIGLSTSRTWLNSSTSFGTSKLNLSGSGAVRLLEINREDAIITPGIASGPGLTLSTVPFGNGTNGTFGNNVLGYMRNPLESTGTRALTVPLSDTGNEPIIKLEASGAGSNAFAGITMVANRPILGVYNFTTPLLTILAAGNVGIGTTTTGSHKLAVEGSIGAREIKVQATGWSDFVFKKDYKLPTLKEVEKHIAEKGYLENIPSEEEVMKNGINLGEMNSKLLQKIEELTLYVIEQEKKSDKLKAFILEQGNLILEQNKRLEKLENKR